MTAKQQFLAKMKAHIDKSEAEVKAMKDAYIQNEKLPDSFFQFLQPEPANDSLQIGIYKPSMHSLDKLRQKVSELPVEYIDATKVADAMINSDYGRNRRLVLQILKDKGRAVLKSEIVKKFEHLTGEKNAVGIITNALAALSTEGTIVGFKDEEVKVRGLYWALKTWFENDKIKEAHKPEPYNKYADLI